MIENYNWCIERRDPFHPEHYMVGMRYGWEPDFAWLIDVPCAPAFFQSLSSQPVGSNHSGPEHG